MFKIQTLNSISDIIHDTLTAEKYLVSKEEPVPDGILVRSADMKEAVLPANLLAIARAGAGVNNIPIDRCTQQGIAVFNTPGANANAVAELVICGLMLGGRNISGGIDWVRTLTGDDIAKQVEKGKGQFAGPEVRGKTLGVIGLGAIGAIVANAASQGLGMNVIGYDPFISVDNAWSLSRSVRHASSVEEVYRQADYITVHIPLKDDTRASLNAAAFAQMKKGVRLLNFSRAEIMHFADLKAALESGQVAGYVTDFPTPEVMAMPNTIALPHLGASTPESEINCADMAAKELRDYLEFGQIRNSVNLPEVLLGRSEGTRILLIHDNTPGMVSAISAAVSSRGMNILNMINRSRNTIAVTVLEVDSQPDSALTAHLGMLKGITRVRVIG